MRKTSIAAMTIAAAIVMAACNSKETKKDDAVYATMTVRPVSKTLYANYTAVIKGRQNVEVRPQVSGTITRICIEEGAAVRKGQLLFVIDQVPYRAALDNAIANVKSAEAKLATARLNYKSKNELHKEKVVSDYDLTTASNALLEAQAALEQAEAQEREARNNLSYTEVKSPVDGVTSMIPYRVGALVNSSISTPLVTVSDDSEVYAYFSMTENHILDLLQKDTSMTNIIGKMPSVELQLSNGTRYGHKGRIDAISGTVDTQTGSVSVRAVYPNHEGLLRNGGSGLVILPLTRENCIVIPQTATYELQNKVFVYKVVDGKTVSVPVSVYEVSDGKEYIVESGLADGDVIIAEGAGLLKDGVEVRTKDVSKR
ncbi:MAG: efflux RND transporter periplasmic adaptor subunit [Prevotella sp.]